jgi:YNFM family putative membrane transporter
VSGTAGRYRPIILLSIAAFASAATLRVADPLLPQVAAEFTVSVGEASVIATTFAFAYGTSQIFYGPLGDRIGKFRLVALMTLLSAVTASVCAAATSVGALGFFRLLSGATCGALIPLSIAYIGDVVPYEDRQVVLARFASGQMTGVIAGQVFGGVFGDFLGWRGIFLALGAIYLVIAVLLYRERRSPHVVEHRLPASGLRGLSMRYVGLFRNRAVLIVLGTTFVEGLLFFGGFAFVGAFLRHEFEMSYVAVGAILGSFGLGGLFYASTVRVFVTRLGPRTMVLLGGTILAATFVAIAVLPMPALAAPALALTGLGFYLFHNTLQTAATQMSPHARGLALSVFAAWLFIGQAIGVALCGMLIDRAGYAPVFAGTGVLLLLLALIFRSTLERRV